MTMDRAALQYTLEWVTTHDVAVSGAEVITDLLPITRRVDDIRARDEELRAAVARIESRRLVGV